MYLDIATTLLINFSLDILTVTTLHSDKSALLTIGLKRRRSIGDHKEDQACFPFTNSDIDSKPLPPMFAIYTIHNSFCVKEHSNNLLSLVCCLKLKTQTQNVFIQLISDTI